MDLTEREHKLQYHRLRMNTTSITNVILQTMIIGLYAWRGTVSWVIVLAFLLATVGSAVVFRVFIVTKANLRFKDQSMLFPQIVSAVTTQLIFMVLAPQLAIIFLVSILVFYNYAMVSFNKRQFAATWLFIGAATAFALYLGRDRFGYPGDSGMDIAILWLFFLLAIRSLTNIGAQFSALRAKLSEKNLQLQAALEKNQELAIRDELTGCYNRRYFMQILEQEWERSQRTKEMFCLAMLDLDHFKSINDNFGHLVGDTVLKTFCTLAQQQIRGTDRFARYGGEEFALILPATTPIESAMVAVERVRIAVQQYRWDAIAPGLALTVSIGVTAYCIGEPLETLLGRVDNALYNAKNSGRNQIVCA